MKLSTKKLFCNEKLISKKKLSSKNTFATSTNKAILKPRTRKRLNTCLNKDKILDKVNKIQKTLSSKRNKNIISSNNISYKTQRFNFDHLKMNDFLNNTEEISDFNNLASTLESESIKQINEPFDVEKLCGEFKKSTLRSAFIMDDDGNNYLNFEQKKIIEDYFDKKKNLQNNINKSKINTIKVQEYHKNDISSKCNANDCLYRQNLNEKKDINIKTNDNNINNVNKKKIIPLKFGSMGNRLGIGRRMLSTKINQNIKILLNDDNESKNENKNDELKNNNSLFENYNDKSMDSSFLDSSIGEELVKTIL